MYAVIFRAKLARPDGEYEEMAKRLRELARSEYGCVDFFSIQSESEEIAISYWDSEDQIRRWKADPLHRRAQAAGRSKWYASFSVEVVHVERSYASRAADSENPRN